MGLAGSSPATRTNHSRATSAQGFTDTINAVQLQAASSSETARAWRCFFEELESLTADDRVILDVLALAAFRAYDSGLLQAKLGSLDADTKEMIYRRIGGWFEYDYYRDWWSRNHWAFSEPLMSYVESEFGLHHRTNPSAT